MGRAPCCEKMGLKKGPWTSEEDQILVSFIQNHGHSNWRALPKQAGLLRCGKSCRLRWMNYLRPDIKRGNFTKEEEDTIINLHEMLGNRWSAIAARLPGRTDNEIKNVWHTHLKKRLKGYERPKPKSSNKKNLNKSKSESESESNGTRSESELANSNTSAVQSSTYSASLSPSSSSSVSDISSTPFTSREGDNNKIIEIGSGESSIEDYCFSFENVDAEIDESFWRDALYGSDPNRDSGRAVAPAASLQVNGSDELGHQFQFGSVDDQMVLDGYGNDDVQNIDDGMEFWYELFMKTGGEQELPGVPLISWDTRNTREHGVEQELKGFR